MPFWIKETSYNNGNRNVLFLIKFATESVKPLVECFALVVGVVVSSLAVAVAVAVAVLILAWAL